MTGPSGIFGAPRSSTPRSVVAESPGAREPHGDPAGVELPAPCSLLRLCIPGIPTGGTSTESYFTADPSAPTLTLSAIKVPPRHPGSTTWMWLR
ncbi:hypothetical protein JHW43_009174 [Diplocarpon mali]|nr:hypothetical protein JHW43_009174 [Diplocarpon mali]